MVKKILLTILLMITQSLVNSQEQKVPDTNQFRHSQTASDDGIVEATQPVSPATERYAARDDVDEASNSEDDQVVPTSPKPHSQQ